MNWIASRIGRGPPAWLPSRRRIARGAATRTNREAQLDALDDDALERHLAKQPRDALAVEIRAERHRKAGDWTAYARDTEYLLTLKHGMDAEEEGSRRLELSRVEERLGRPERAEAVLRGLIERFPRRYQSTLARERLEARARGTAREAPDADRREGSPEDVSEDAAEDLWVRRRREPRRWKS